MAQTAPRQSSSLQSEAAPRSVVGRMRAGATLVCSALATRRLLAWTLEVSLLVGSVALPWSLGEGVRQRATEPGVPMMPGVAIAQDAIARTLGLPKPPRLAQVPPLTNLLWFCALGLPLIWVGSQLYWLAAAGKTLPKHWLGLQVVIRSGGSPGPWRTIGRELGRWSVPILLAYGLWQGSGAFPHLGLLGSLTVLALTAEGATLLLNRSGRAWHDRIAGTQVILARGVYIPVRYRLSSSDGGRPEPSYAAALADVPLTVAEEEGGLVSVVLAPLEASSARPEGASRQLLVGTLMVGLGLMAVVAISPQLYGQQQQTERSRLQQSNDLLLALIASLDGAHTPQEQQTAVLALSSTDDARAIPLLVDLLGQTQNPVLLETLQQAVVSLGPTALQPLLRLNQTLASDIALLPPDQQPPVLLRQQAVKRTLAKLLALYGDQLEGGNLSRAFLGKVVESPDAFTLVLDQRDLAGLIWQGAVLSGGSFRQSRFFAAGSDQRPDTYDDLITDLSGSDLTETDLSGADLRYVLFQGSSLLRATLSNSQARLADFSQANLSSARLISADLSRATLDQASLVGADVTGSNLSGASLVAARLQKLQAMGASFVEANLSGAEGQEVNFSNANLSDANLQGADLSGSQFQGSNLSRANLAGANLRGSDLSTAVLQGANLTDTDLQSAIFVGPTAVAADSFIESVPQLESGGALAGVDFTEARNLDQAQIAYICMQQGIHPVCSENPGVNSK